MFGWMYMDGDGNDVGASDRFEDPDAAESWMGQSWEGLLEVGVEEVVLVDHDRGKRLYRMGLNTE